MADNNVSLFDRIMAEVKSGIVENRYVVKLVQLHDSVKSGMSYIFDKMKQLFDKIAEIPNRLLSIGDKNEGVIQLKEVNVNGMEKVEGRINTRQSQELTNFYRQ